MGTGRLSEKEVSEHTARSQLTGGKGKDTNLHHAATVRFNCAKGWMKAIEGRVREVMKGIRVVEYPGSGNRRGKANCETMELGNELKGLPSSCRTALHVVQAQWE